MHDSALALGTAFFRHYAASGKSRVLDIGARNVNGSLRGCAPPQTEYVGVDIETGPGVDVVLRDPCVLPFSDGTFDVVVSTSCFEHIQFFWLAFLELARVTRAGGFVYVNAPSNGCYHGYPFDHWRFYPDAGLALEAWGRRNEIPITLIESFMAPRSADGIWNDCVMVFERANEATPRTSFIYEGVDGAYNVRRFDHDDVINLQSASEDARRIGELEIKVAILSRKLRGDSTT